MVKIDGSRVRQLREKKGLTQLYVATAVEVTTDTISRWENRRYPTIKKENGLRLAKALEVDLEEILEKEEIEESLVQVPTQEDEHLSIPTTRSPKKIQPLLLVLGAVFVIFLILSFILVPHFMAPGLSATRRVPSHYTLQQPFPIAIAVDTASASPIALIVNEQLPPTLTILNSSPPQSPAARPSGRIKWLNKAQGKVIFTYIAAFTTAPSAGESFSGTVSISNNADSPYAIEGPGSLNNSTFHWADSNGDNIINDKEILNVYDQYGDLEALGVDIDLIEEIWLGSGYRWDKEQQRYEILP